MRNLSQLSSVSSTLSNNLTLAPLALVALGWKELGTTIALAEEVDRESATALKIAQVDYEEEPSLTTFNRLQKALDTMIEKLQAEYTHVLKLQSAAETRLTQSSLTSDQGWGGQIRKFLQQQFESDDASLIKRYQQISENREMAITELQRYQQNLNRTFHKVGLLSTTSSINGCSQSRVGTFSDGSFVIGCQYRWSKSDVNIYFSAYSPSEELLSEWSIEKKYDESYPAIKTFPNSKYVVVYQSNDYGGEVTDYDIYARVYQFPNASLKDEFRVSLTYNNETYPSIDANIASNSFIIAWTENVSGGKSTIRAQRYDRISYSMIGNVISVSDFDDGVIKDQVTIGEFSNGAFVSAWHRKEGDNEEVYARCFDSSGRAMSSSFRVNQFSDNIQSRPHIGVFNDDSFIVIWQSQQDNDGYDIYGRIYRSDCVAKISEFSINSVTEGDQTSPRVSIFNSNKFVIAWNSDSGIKAKRYEYPGGQYKALSEEIEISDFKSETDILDVGAIRPTDGYIVFVYDYDGDTWRNVYKDIAVPHIFKKKYNILVIHQGETLTIDSSMLQIETNTNPGDVIFTVETVVHGKFAKRSSAFAIDTFTQLEINNKEILFIHDGTDQPPDYKLLAKDAQSSFPVSPLVNFTSTSIPTPTPAPEAEERYISIIKIAASIFGPIFGILVGSLYYKAHYSHIMKQECRLAFDIYKFLNLNLHYIADHFGDRKRKYQEAIQALEQKLNTRIDKELKTIRQEDEKGQIRYQRYVGLLAYFILKNAEPYRSRTCGFELGGFLASEELKTTELEKVTVQEKIINEVIDADNKHQEIKLAPKNCCASMAGIFCYRDKQSQLQLSPRSETGETEVEELKRKFQNKDALKEEKYDEESDSVQVGLHQSPRSAENPQRLTSPTGFETTENEETLPEQQTSEKRFNRCSIS